MSVLQEIDRPDGIIEVTPNAVGELVREVRRLRAALKRCAEVPWARGDIANDIAIEALGDHLTTPPENQCPQD